MSKIAIVYWSGTGNTQSMAEAVKAGAESSGATVDMFSPSDVDLENCSALGRAIA